MQVAAAEIGAIKIEVKVQIGRPDLPAPPSPQTLIEQSLLPPTVDTTLIACPLVLPSSLVYASALLQLCRLISPLSDCSFCLHGLWVKSLNWELCTL